MNDELREPIGRRSPTPGSLDLFTFGEALLRLSVPQGLQLETASKLDLHPGGAEANAAIALSRLGRSCQWWSRLPANSLGRRVAADLRAAGVDISAVDWDDDARIGTYYTELKAAPSSVSIIYDRKGSSASRVAAADVPMDLVDRARWVLLTGITPALSEGCHEATLAIAERAKSRGAHLAIDVNYRTKLWDVQEAADCLGPLAEGASLLICTREDSRDVFGIQGSPEDVAARLAEVTGATRIALTLGGEGVLGLEKGELYHVGAVSTTIVDRIGAGDALTAGVIDGLLDGSFKDGLERGAALSAIVLGTAGDRFIGTRSDMESAMADVVRAVDR